MKHHTAVPFHRGRHLAHRARRLVVLVCSEERLQQARMDFHHDMGSICPRPLWWALQDAMMVVVVGGEKTSPVMDDHDFMMTLRTRAEMNLRHEDEEASCGEEPSTWQESKYFFLFSELSVRFYFCLFVLFALVPLLNRSFCFNVASLSFRPSTPPATEFLWYKISRYALCYGFLDSLLL